MNTTSSPAPDSFVQMLPDSPFSLQNLPFGIGKPKKGDDQSPRLYSRIGNYAVDLSVFERAGYFRDVPLGGQKVFTSSSLKGFIEAGPEAHRHIQQIVADLLRFDRPMWLDEPELRDEALTLLEMVEMQLPLEQNSARLITESSFLAYQICALEHDDSSKLNAKKVSVDRGHEILLDHHGDRMLPEMELEKSEHQTVKEVGLAYLCGPKPEKDLKKNDGVLKSTSNSKQKIIGVTTAAILTNAHQEQQHSIILSPWVTFLSNLTPFISSKNQAESKNPEDDRSKPTTVLKLDCAIHQLDHQLDLISQSTTQLEFPIANPSHFFPVDTSDVPLIQSGDLIFSSPKAEASQLKSNTPLSTMYPLTELIGSMNAESLDEGFLQISVYGETANARLGTGEMLIRI